MRRHALVLILLLCLCPWSVAADLPQPLTDAIAAVTADKAAVEASQAAIGEAQKNLEKVTVDAKAKVDAAIKSHDDALAKQVKDQATLQKLWLDILGPLPSPGPAPIPPKPTPPIPDDKPTPKPPPKPQTIIALRGLILENSDERKAAQVAVDLWWDSHLPQGTVLRYDVRDDKLPAPVASYLDLIPLVSGKPVLPYLFLLAQLQDKTWKIAYQGIEPETTEAFQKLWKESGGKI